MFLLERLSVSSLPVISPGEIVETPCPIVLVLMIFTPRRALVCSSGPGLESLFKVGKSIQGVIGSEDAEVDSSTIEALKAAAEKANIEIELAHSNGH